MKLMMLINGFLVLLIGVGILHHEYPHNPLSQIFVKASKGVPHNVLIDPSLHSPTLIGDPLFIWQDQDPISGKDEEAGRTSFNFRDLSTGNIYGLEGNPGMTIDQASTYLESLNDEELSEFLINNPEVSHIDTSETKFERYRKSRPMYNDITDEDLFNKAYEKFYFDIPYKDYMRMTGFTPSSKIWKRDWMMGAYIVLAVFIVVEALTLLIGYTIRGNVVAQRLTIVLSALWFLITVVVNDPFTGILGEFQLDIKSLLGVSILPVVIIWGIIWIIKGFQTKPTS